MNEYDTVLIMGAFAGTMLIIVTFLILECLNNAQFKEKIMEPGDEVTTTDEYTKLFNESFSGRIVSIDELYTVRDENGTERSFDWKWIDHIDDGGDI